MPVYVDSTATGDNSGSSWANAYPDIRVALNLWVTADGDILVAEEHADSEWNEEFTTATTRTNRVNLYRTNKTTGEYSPVDLDTTAPPNTISRGFKAFATYHGLHFDVENNAFNFSNGAGSNYVDCLVDCVTGIGSQNSTEVPTFIRGKLRVSNPNSDRIFSLGAVKCRFEATLFESPVAVTLILFGAAGGIDLIGCDFTECTLNYVYATNSSQQVAPLTTNIIDCKFPANIPLYAGAVNNFPQDVKVVDCSYGGEKYLDKSKTEFGYIEASNIIYVADSLYRDFKTGDITSYMMRPSSQCGQATPFVCLPIGAIIAADGSVNFSLELLHTFTSLNAEDVWVDISYASDIAESVIYSSREIKQTTPTELTAGIGTGAWVSPPVGSTSFKFSGTLADAKKGRMIAKVYLAKYEIGKAVFVDTGFKVS